MTSITTIKRKIDWNRTLPSILLVVNTFVWFVITYVVFNIVVNELMSPETEKFIFFTLYFLGISVSAIIGPYFFPQRRINLLYIWVFTNSAVTILLITVPSNDLFTNSLFTLSLGTSIGVGLPSCLSYFAESTSIENRGSVGGVTWVGVGFIVLFFIISLNWLEISEAIIALAIWRFLGGISFIFLTKHQKLSAVHKHPSYSVLLHDKKILLYLFPWIMFSLINFAEAPILEATFGGQAFTFASVAEYFFIGIIAFIGGITADIAGRKRIVIGGFVTIGIEYAALSIFYHYSAALYLFMVLDGITWGLFFPVFFMTVWGDLGEGYEKEKYYALGGLPFLLAKFLSLLVRPYVSVISPSAAFSFASFFLFLAVIPLMFAPETLPEKAMKERELKSYIEKAKKVREKFT